MWRGSEAPWPAGSEVALPPVNGLGVRVPRSLSAVFGGPERRWSVTPELRQFGTLTGTDFDRVPIWLACHVADYDEPWYEETDEETFRPWDGEIPVEPQGGMYLVKATATLADGSSLPGFLTPADGNDLGSAQPQLFAGAAMVSFWGGVMGVPEQQRAAFYASLGKAPDAVFPILFSVAPGLVREQAAIQVDGFYRIAKGGKAVVER